jgi:hypothetical protein
MMAVFMLMVETWGLAALISAEVEAGTLRALLVTHLNVPGLFISKGVTGILMAFVQAVILVGLRVVSQPSRCSCSPCSCLVRRW